jgi:tape measure domain-containing protein
MSEIKRSMRGLNSEAKITANNMKFGARDTASYKKNLDQLSGTTEKQRKNVEDLGKRYAEVVEEQGASSRAAQNLATEFNKQADNLNRLESQLSAAKDEMHELYVESSNFTKIGNFANTAGDSIQTMGGHAQRVGGSLTKWITAPVLGAVTAVGGLTAALGWGRLVGIDNARAQLQGMGYDAKEVEGITGEVSDAIQGGMMTMAEGTATAAGAMAAGVERGDELAKYLQLVDAAAVGANRPVSEMAQIFNRVQGGGRLMTQELNMIEDGMPGFSMAMAEHLGVGIDEFREMVSAGEVSSQDFLDVMDGFAGGMAEAFSGTFSGMVQNTKAWIGILGQNLLGGVFEQSKESIGEFMELLKSDDLQAWATETGERLGTMFSGLVENIKDAVNWFIGLGSEKLKLIGIISAVAVAAGPLLTVLGTMTIFVGSVVKAIAPLFLGLGKLAGGFKTVMAGVKPFAVVFPKLASLFAIITGPIGITVAAIVGLGAAFVTAYARSETFRDFIAGLADQFKGAWETAMQLKDNLVTAFQGIFAIFSGDRAGGIQLLQSLGLDEGTIQTILNTINTIQINFHKMRIYIGKAFNAVREVVMTVLDTVVGFVQEKIAQIVGFWNTDGQQILQAVQNIFSGISTAISATLNFIMPIIKSALNGILNIFKVVWPAVLFVVQMVWENIKGVINGGLRFIQGLVQVFSGIFTGDFSKMWEGVKNIFSGAIQFVWNLFQLMFWGRIIRGITSFVRGGIALFRNFGTQTGSVFTNMWQAVVRIFTNLWQGAMRIFNNMRTGLTNTVQNINTGINNIISRMVSAVLNFFGNLFTRGVQIFNNLRTSLTNTTNNIRSGISNTISNMVSAVLRFFRNLLSNALNIFNNMRTGLTNRIQAVRDNVVNAVSRMRDRALNIYRDLKDKAAGFLTDMVDGAKKLPGRIGNGIKNMASKAVDGIKSLGNSMVGKLGEVVNGVIGGLNSITSKIGISATIDKWNVPTFSTGTGQGSPTGNLTRNGKIAMDTLATVGDKGPGNGPGTRELVHYPNGKVGLYDNDATIFAPKGTTIYSNQETEALLGMIPRFSKGTGLWDRITNIASKAVDYITNPSKIFEDLISAVSGGFEGLNGFMLTMAKGAFDFLKDKFLSWITDRFSESTVGTKQSWMDYRMTTPYSPNAPVPGYPKAFNNGHHYGIDYATPIGVNITAPFAGTVKKQHDVGGGIVARLANGKAAQYFLHMSSVKPGTVGVGESVGKSGNSGLFTTGAHVHWQHEEPSSGRLTNKNTKNPLKQIGSHMLGGLALTDGLINVHKGEYIINPNHPTEAMKLIALAGKQVAAKSKQTRELPNPSRSNDSSVMERLLEKTIEQNQILMELLNKDTDLHVDGKKMTEALDPYMEKMGGRKIQITGRGLA